MGLVASRAGCGLLFGAVLCVVLTGCSEEDDPSTPAADPAAAQQLAEELVAAVVDGDRAAAARIAPPETVTQLFDMSSGGGSTMKVTRCGDRSDPELVEYLGDADLGCRISTRFGSDDASLDLLRLDEVDGEWRVGALVGITST